MVNLIFQIGDDTDFVKNSLTSLGCDETLINVVKKATMLNPEERFCASDLLKLLHKSSIVLQYIVSENSRPKVGLDNFGNIVELNEIAASMFGFVNREEAIGYPLKTVLSKVTALYYETEISKYLKDDVRFQEGKRKACVDRKIMIKKKHDDYEFPAVISFYDVTCDKEKGNIRAIAFFNQIPDEEDHLGYVDESLERILVSDKFE
jgi:transcriptional regulator with PAS, ATPase and Fis domain